ncbi:hypothetical protein NCS57_00971700 [Fusarium keratoplasticum]|uniref:Uncharacterized protein n=1 Tax=Fusarium keratoplasticum TaxID=1328300 RepID=A0ACC0QSP8_9HYPO|nr:hypothetical protein NCS57_00971700 [Fusarium keratoplasticum]KAI8663699.1 hypothetical protein NCS57_00971700 [Fusarium keratoplasticum]
MSTTDAAAPTAPAPNGETLLSDRGISDGAARQIFNATPQWPWQLAAGFSPKVWDAMTLEELAQTIDRLIKESTEADPHVEIHNLIEFLGEQARERARLCLQSNPELRLVDKISGPTAFASRVTAGNRKRTHESSGDSQANKSARRDGPGSPGGLALGSPAKTVTPAEGLIDSIEPVQGEALTPSSMSDMIGTVENLKVESQTYLNESTRKLDKARSLTKQRETSLHKVPTPGKLEELRRACDQWIEAKETIEKAKALFEQHQGEMALDPLLVSLASQEYDRKLRKCEEGVAQAEAELHNMEMTLTFTTQQGDKRQDKLEEVQAKVTRLETRQTHLALEFEYYRTIERLMKLGPHGLASLTERLAESGISLLTAADDPEVRNEPSINPPS